MSRHFVQQQSAFSIMRKPTLHLIQTRAIAKRQDSGLTLIEGLVAIILISITMVSITPPIFWAVASRVQTQRAEQALKLAQGEIDRVRTLIERNEGTTTDLPPTAATNPPSETDVRNSASTRFPAAPTTAGTGVISTGTCTSVGTIPPATIATFAQIDTNGDCQADYLLQTFRSQGLDQTGAAFTGATGQRLSGFVMGVRVYAALASNELTNSRGRTEAASLRGTNGLGNQLNRPLTVLYSTIVRSTDAQNLDLYRRLCSTTTTGAC